ncbi:MAG: DNA mismatch repair endonuclease MutL [Bacteroidales bacterium]|nr:DNA mismatch repair endonuclease MutL [Bacteroidales bacterium]
MSRIIAVLPEHVANQIAAGEVVQQASSVVKELMENAIDANATQIDGLIKDAGKTLIQINDNGKGMSAEDAALCFERHATSKLKQASDLFSLQTKGFRGEALASIAAIAQVELHTRRPEDELGSKVTIAASQIESQDEIVMPAPGTRFMVRNLFYNVPARRKFLGSNAKQFLAIRNEFIHLALAHPDLGMKLCHNGETLYDLHSSSLRQRIIALFGATFNKKLYPIDVETDFVRISGFIGDPSAANKRSSEQFLFANQRFIRHPYLRKAILDVYENLIPNGLQPAYFLFLDVPADNIDVNISPTKTEVKFEHEQVIWPILNAAVRECLGKFNAVPSIDFDREDAPEINVFPDDKELLAPRLDFDKHYNPFASTNNSTHFAPSHNRSYAGDVPKKQNWESLIDTFESARDYKDVFQEDTQAYGFHLDTPINADIVETPKEVLETLFNDESSWDLFQERICQLFGRYLMLPMGDSLLFIDQHRASVRILFEQYVRQLSAHQSVSQSLLFPEDIDLPQHLLPEFESIIEELNDLGFRFEKTDAHYTLCGIPEQLGGKDAHAVLQELLDAKMEERPNIEQVLSERLALQMAKSTALPYGQTLSDNEQIALCRQLFASAIQNFTPDGKRIIVSMSQEELIKKF